MSFEPRVLPRTPYETLPSYVDAGGGAGLDAARRVEPEVVIAELEASGLRGRGGGGFPTGAKWRTVAENRSPEAPTTVVVNAAEGEPGTYKDRAILADNPYAVLEGALIAALAVGADRLIVAMKAADAEHGSGSGGDHLERVRAAGAEVEAAGWCDGVDVEVFEGPEEYLYGEETALLEVLAGRPPFPRIAPPFRHGADELIDPDPSDASDERSGGTTAAASGSGANVEFAGPGDETPAPPTLVNNVETLANVPAIVARGAAWFRELGTDGSPGTVVCTVTGGVLRDGVGEVPMGTSLAEVIEVVGGGVARGRRVVGVLGGASNPVLPGELLETPLTYEAMEDAGVGLGSASLTVLVDDVDVVAVAAGYARFLAVESCGQCTPCKADGLEVADRLQALCAGRGSEGDLEVISDRLGTVADGARCNLARQTQALVGSLFDHHVDAFRAHADGTSAPVEPVLVGEIDQITDGRAIVSPSAATKQPDWTHDGTWSGAYPAAEASAGGGSAATETRSKPRR